MPLVASMEGRGEDTPEQPGKGFADEPTPSPPPKEPTPPQTEPTPPPSGEPTAPAGEPTPTPNRDAPQPPDEPAAEDAAPVAPAPEAPPPTRDDRRGWLLAGLVVLAAAVIGVVIGTSLGGRQGGPLGNQPNGNGRPTIVVGNVAPSPSPLVAASPSPLPSTQIAGGTPGVPVPGSTEYVVQPGDTLQGIAEEQYGDAGQWSKIYQANRDVIGPDPDALAAGTTLQLPPAE